MLKTPEIIAIAALGKQTRNIGHGDKLLWHISEDLKRLKEITNGHPLIMGRKTYESIGKPLPNRTNIILTRNAEYKADESCVIVNSVASAIEMAKKSPGGTSKIFIFGGAEIYNLFLKQTDRLLLTQVDSDKEGTATFPAFEEDFTVVNESEIKFHSKDGVEIPYQWVEYIRKP